VPVRAFVYKVIFQQAMKIYHENSSIFSQSCLLLIKHLNLAIEVEDHEPHNEQFVNEINPIFKVPIFIDDDKGVELIKMIKNDQK
jgi:glutathione S-transferase